MRTGLLLSVFLGTVATGCSGDDGSTTSSSEATTTADTTTGSETVTSGDTGDATDATDGTTDESTDDTTDETTGAACIEENASCDPLEPTDVCCGENVCTGLCQPCVPLGQLCDGSGPAECCDGGECVVQGGAGGVCQ